MTLKKKNSATKFLEKLIGEELSFGALLRSIREGEGMTQVEFAECLGISRQYLCDIEKRRKIVSPRAAATFAESLGYSSAQFVCLALQDLIDRDGLELIINVEAA